MAACIRRTTVARRDAFTWSGTSFSQEMPLSLCSRTCPHLFLLNEYQKTNGYSRRLAQKAFLDMYPCRLCSVDIRRIALVGAMSNSRHMSAIPKVTINLD